MRWERKLHAPVLLLIHINNYLKLGTAYRGKQAREAEVRHTFGLPFSAGHPQPPEPRGHHSTHASPGTRCQNATLVPELFKCPRAPSSHHHLLTMPRSCPRRRAKGKPAVLVDLMGPLGSEVPPGCSQAGCSWSHLHLDQTTRALSPQQRKDNEGSSNHPFPLVA